MSEPVVSVVIPTFGRPLKLHACLAALAAQAMSEPWEVIVVDDGSPQPLEGLNAAFAGRLDLRVIRQVNAGPAAARNRGVQAARGEFIAFTDDDCLPEREWLASLLRKARTRPDALVGGTAVNGLPHDMLAETNQLILDLVYEHFNADPDDARFFASNNMMCGRRQMLELGGFDETFPCAGGEDRDLCDRWRAAGLKLVSCPEARVTHLHAQTLGRFLNLHYRYGRGAHIFQARRKARGTGTMSRDIAFHSSLPRLVPGRVLRRWGWGRAVPVMGALALWQVANAAGFFAQACAVARPRALAMPAPLHQADQRTRRGGNRA